MKLLFVISLILAIHIPSYAAEAAAAAGGESEPEQEQDHSLAMSPSTAAAAAEKKSTESEATPTLSTKLTPVAAATLKNEHKPGTNLGGHIAYPFVEADLLKNEGLPEVFNGVRLTFQSMESFEIPLSIFYRKEKSYSLFRLQNYTKGDPTAYHALLCDQDETEHLVSGINDRKDIDGRTSSVVFINHNREKMNNVFVEKFFSRPFFRYLLQILARKTTEKERPTPHPTATEPPTATREHSEANTAEKKGFFQRLSKRSKSPVRTKEFQNTQVRFDTARIPKTMFKLYFEPKPDQKRSDPRPWAFAYFDGYGVILNQVETIKALDTLNQTPPFVNIPFSKAKTNDIFVRKLFEDLTDEEMLMCLAAETSDKLLKSSRSASMLEILSKRSTGTALPQDQQSSSSAAAETEARRESSESSEHESLSTISESAAERSTGSALSQDSQSSVSVAVEASDSELLAQSTAPQSSSERGVRQYPEVLSSASAAPSDNQLQVQKPVASTTARVEAQRSSRALEQECTLAAEYVVGEPPLLVFPENVEDVAAREERTLDVIETDEDVGDEALKETIAQHMQTVRWPSVTRKQHKKAAETEGRFTETTSFPTSLIIAGASILASDEFDDLDDEAPHSRQSFVARDEDFDDLDDDAHLQSLPSSAARAGGRVIKVIRQHKRGITRSAEMSPGDNTQLYLENANARREAELAREQRDEARLRAERERRKREELEAQLLQEKSILEATRAAHKRQEANNEEFREHLIENQGAEEVLRKEEEGKRVAMENAMLQQRARIERLQEEIETKRKAEEEKKAKAKAETARALQELEEKYKTDETGLDFDDSVLRVDELELAPFLPPSAIPQLPPSVVAASVPPVIVSALDSRTPRNIAAEDQESLKLSQEAPFLSQKARVEDRPVPTDRPLPQSINSPAVAPVSPPNNEIRLPYSPKASPLLRGGVRPAAQDDSPEPRYKPARRGAAPTMSYMVPAGAKMTYGNGQQFVHADPATFYRLTKPKSVQAPPRSPAAASAAAPGVKANPTSASARKKP